MSKSASRARLVEIIRKRSFGRGEITLASVRKSNFYFNLKPTMLDPEGAAGMPALQSWMRHASASKERLLRENPNVSRDEKIRLLTEYNVLMNLSEAHDHSLRMSELANFVSITVSGLTRVVERLSRLGLVERVRAESDGRGQVAVLTPAGMERLKQAWPSHLAAVRRHVMDHLGNVDLVALADALAEIGSTEVGPPVRRTSPSTV